MPHNDMSYTNPLAWVAPCVAHNNAITQSVTWSMPRHKGILVILLEFWMLASMCFFFLVMWDKYNYHFGFDLKPRVLNHVLNYFWDYGENKLIFYD